MGRPPTARSCSARGPGGHAQEAVESRPTPINRYRALLPRPATHEDLIAVLAWDGRLDDAWAMAIEHGATTPLWVQLGAAREADHPLDAASAYDRQVEELIGRKQTHSYERAVERIAQIRSLHERAGDPDGFDDYLADVRRRHRQKTKLVRLLDEAWLGEPAGARERDASTDAQRLDDR